MKQPGFKEDAELRATLQPSCGDDLKQLLVTKYFLRVLMNLCDWAYAFLNAFHL